VTKLPPRRLAQALAPALRAALTPELSVRPALTTLFFISDENAPRADSRVANKVVRASALHLQRKPSAFSRRAPTLNSALTVEDMKIVDSFEKHRSEPEKTLEAYTREMRMALGNEIAGLKKIYLDSKYWLLLRDAAIGRRRDGEITELLAVLRNGVQEGRIVCPISEDIFSEVLNQSDTETLNETSNLIDALSKGISILSEQERIGFETLYFIRRTIGGEDSVHSPDILVWTKLAHVLGAVHPTSTPFSPQEELVIQKAFFDQMWTISLSQMIKIMGKEAVSRMPRLNDLSYVLNEGKIKYAHENKSFKQLFLSELAGVLDECVPIFEDTMVYLFEKEQGYQPTANEVNSSKAGKQIANAVYNLFRKNKLQSYFPTLVIGAGLHAAVRWDLKRKFKKNDLHDLRHAQTALSYFDFFFTEHSLRDLVTRSNVAFDKKYTREVVSHPNEAIRRAKEICS